ncbi:MAG: hypothetical protein RL757_688 [Bacteroidota bacterium]
MGTSKLSEKWAQLENQRLAVMASIAKLSNETLNQSPAPDAWSVMQVLLHLQTAEKFSEAYMRKKMQFANENNKAEKAGFMAAARSLLLKTYMKLPFKARAPKNLEKFASFTDFATFEKDWAAQRSELYKFLNSLDPKDLETELFKHQVVGKMSVLQMLDFTHAHVARHANQIVRTLQKVAVQPS